MAISNLFDATTSCGNLNMPNLKVINLASNLLTATGFKVLVNSLSPNLTVLNISHNSLGANAIPSISKAISKFPDLTSIYLDNCDIGDAEDDNGIYSIEIDEDNLSSKYLKNN
jgi:hypothetical protein